MEKEEYKVYLIYILLNDTVREEYPYCVNKKDMYIDDYGNEYSLYAYTGIKKVLNIFKKVRDMNLFKVHKVKLDKDEYYRFIGNKYIYSLYLSYLDEDELILPITVLENQISTNYLKIGSVMGWFSKRIKKKILNRISQIVDKTKVVLGNELDEDNIILCDPEVLLRDDYIHDEILFTDELRHKLTDISLLNKLIDNFSYTFDPINLYSYLDKHLGKDKKDDDWKKF